MPQETGSATLSPEVIYSGEIEMFFWYQGCPDVADGVDMGSVVGAAAGEHANDTSVVRANGDVHIMVAFLD